MKQRTRWLAMARIGLQMAVYDKAKFIGTLAGVVFAVVLSAQQIGILLGLLQKNTMFVDKAGADIWIVAPGTTLFQRGEPLPENMVLRARVTPGVAEAAGLLFAQVSIRRPEGGSEPLTLIGTEYPRLLGGPWNLVSGSASALGYPNTMIFEDSERNKFGDINMDSVREISGRQVRVGGFTWGLLPFGPPYAFADLGFARVLSNTPSDRISFVMVRVAPGEDVEVIRQRLQERIPEATVMSTSEYHVSIISHLLRIQLGVTFGTSTAFGLFIGLIIVALSMFSAVLDSIREFGTLKAIGCTNRDLTVLLVSQSIVYALLGSLLGLALVARIAEAMRSPRILVPLPTWLVASAPLLMMGMCILAATLALRRVRKLEPAMVFR